MLGLGSSLATSGGVQGLIPSDISNLDLWLKVNTGIVADSGNTSADGNMIDGEDINTWADQSGNGRHAVETTGNDTEKPHWETDAADFGGLKWPDDIANTHMNLTTGKEIKVLANTDFTIMMRVKIASWDGPVANALMGTSGQDIIKWTTDKRVAVLIGGSGVTEFEEDSDTLDTDTYYIHTLTRSDGGTGNLTFHIHGGSYPDKSWELKATGTLGDDPDEFDIENIGCGSNGILPLEGVIKDVLIWNGTALNESQRNDMYSYINGQEY